MKKGIRYIKKKSKRKHRKTAQICALVFVCFLFVYGIINLVLYHQVSKVPKDKVCDGIYIGQVDVSGLTAKKAQEKIDGKAEEYRAQSVTFQAGKETAEVTLGELGFDIEKEEELIKEAVDYGKDGGIISRYFQLRKLKKEKKVLQPKYTVDEETASAVLKEKVAGLLQGATDATIKRENGKFVITEEKAGVELDTEGTLKALTKYLNQEWKGKNAKVEVADKEHKPSVTKEDLETIQDKLGTFSTYCGNGQSRVVNIKKGAELINGSVVMPGEEFSAGKTMQPFTKENGYVEAGAYENGEVVQDIGGGICQVSTTLYNAVINAELEVTARQPHSMTVAYVKPSRDAAIAGDYKDLRFKNNYDTPIYIEGYVLDGNVVFSVYGKETRKEGRTIEFISETLSTEEPTKKFSEQADAPIGTVTESKGLHKGMKAQLWKVVYENGKEVSREVFNKSTYKASVNKVTVGTASSNPEYTKQMQEAIKSQDEAKIQAAIADIKAKETAAAETNATDAAKQQEGQ